MAYLLAALGGALGALARWVMAVALPRTPDGWPWATLTVNLLGCFCIGVLLTVLELGAPEADRLRTFLGAGVLGGFTTFSTFAVEFADLVAAGSPFAAVGYCAASVLGGLVAVALGAVSGRALAGGWR